MLGAHDPARTSGVMFRPRHHAGVLKLSSVLTRSTQRQPPITQGNGSVQRDHPDFRRQSRVQLPPVPRTDWLEAAGVCDLLLGLNGFARAAHRTQETLDCLVDWFIIKRYNPATARWQRRTGHRAGKGPRASEPTPRPSTCPPAWKPTTPALPGFYGGALD